ncbi:a164 [Rat cytomegalovirus ALL-03]|uniref:A164 n=2 Tax=Rat cytomegalovirus (isolate England) TaxID=1261657 RepID=A0A0F6R4D4_RCMVE|nr:e164 [Murid betaherpesvirus 8]AKE44313.1 a164 [Rat cytomegalovirus ALL-03]AFX83463.1 e164 [Murid betaherpesvirus 8]WEG71935.1 protein m164 [Murid betaherpesvirus 8]WPH25325.1 protein m164 [Murid betaherpesvirus 8]WPH25458.1 protein m164 [Murid betaherpesvirus 8]
MWVRRGKHRCSRPRTSFGPTLRMSRFRASNLCDCGSHRRGGRQPSSTFRPRIRIAVTPCRSRAYRKRGWTLDDYRARTIFKLGMLALICASVAKAEPGCRSYPDGGVECAKLYPSISKPALVCNVRLSASTKFYGQWSVVEYVNSKYNVTSVIAIFEENTFTLKQAGFLGLVDPTLYQTELWPPTGFSGNIMCTVGHVSQVLCLIPPPIIDWALGTDDLVTVNRSPRPEDASAHNSCKGDIDVHSESTDLKYTHTFWAVDGKGVVGASEDEPGEVTFNWLSRSRSKFTMNISSMSLTFPPRKDKQTCVTCIAGFGGNILSLSTTECRLIRPPSYDVPVVCFSYRSFVVSCSIIVIAISFIAYAYFASCNRFICTFKLDVGVNELEY